jgi:hypothetical protein
VKAQQSGGVRWKIRTPHRRTEDMPFHEWHWTGEPVKADTLGRRNDRMWQAHWASVRCLYEECPAEALIRIGDLVAVLPVVAVKPRVTQPDPPTVDSVPPTPPHSNGGPANQQAPEQPPVSPELLTTAPHKA